MYDLLIWYLIENISNACIKISFFYNMTSLAMQCTFDVKPFLFQYISLKNGRVMSYIFPIYALDLCFDAFYPAYGSVNENNVHFIFSIYSVLSVKILYCCFFNFTDVVEMILSVFIMPFLESKIIHQIINSSIKIWWINQTNMVMGIPSLNLFISYLQLTVE